MSLFGGDSVSNTTQIITTTTGNHENARDSINFVAGGGNGARLTNYAVRTYLNFGDSAIGEQQRTLREEGQSITSGGITGSIAGILGLADGATMWILGGLVAIWLFVGRAKA